VDGLHAWHESYFIIHVYHRITSNVISICDFAPA
jgi:hypothetical protein